MESRSTRDVDNSIRGACSSCPCKSRHSMSAPTLPRPCSGSWTLDSAGVVIAVMVVSPKPMTERSRGV